MSSKYAILNLMYPNFMKLRINLKFTYSTPSDSNHKNVNKQVGHGGKT